MDIETYPPPLSLVDFAPFPFESCMIWDILIAHPDIRSFPLPSRPSSRGRYWPSTLLCPPITTRTFFVALIVDTPSAHCEPDLKIASHSLLTCPIGKRSHHRKREQNPSNHCVEENRATLKCGFLPSFANLTDVLDHVPRQPISLVDKKKRTRLQPRLRRLGSG